MSPDAELLRRYSRQHDERAFAELVQRHLGLVYAAALRRTGGRVHLAEDISQKVFVELARRAAQLDGHPALVGWLYRCTRNAAIDVMRAEQSRQRSAQAFANLPDTAPADFPVDWEQVRPVLDEAMDQIKERDRELMLLRFFQGLTFTEIGARLDLSENAARMRTERALEKLRFKLGQRGITSTAALASLLTGQSLVAAPASLAASVTTAALAAAPAAGGLVAFFLMSKITTPLLGAALAAGLTTVAWTTFGQSVNEKELAALRAENVRLTQSTTIGADAAVAGEFASQAAAIVGKVEQRIGEKNAGGATQHRNHGQATPRDAFLSYAWAMDAGEVTALTRVITFEEKGLESVRTIYAGMPAAFRAQFSTPEELIAFFLVADTLLHPVPGVDVAEGFVATETGPGRAAVRPPGTKQGGMNFVQTAQGWKCVVPDGYPAHLAERILGNEMLGKLGLN